MEKIEPGKYVELVYDLYKVNPDGSEELVHQTDEKDPEAIIFGVTPGLVVTLAEDIEGKEKGYEYDVVATADQAYGQRSDEYIAQLEREVFEVDGKFDSDLVKVGNALPMQTADGMRIIGTVLEVTPEFVKMDFNHPLAGSTVRFKGKVQEVREATPDELKFVQGGCGCDDSGDDCGDDCGSDCNCSSGCGCK